MADLKTLTARPHRLAGRPDGSRAASEYVERRLKEIGLREIYVQEFPLVQPRMTECELVCGAGFQPANAMNQQPGKAAPHRRYAIHAMRPNILQASVTPAEGLPGETIYLGRGEAKDYADRLADGKIAVFDFDCADNWLKAFAFGAKAVLFIEQDGVAANAWHHVNVPANLPRFYVSAKVAGNLEIKKRPRQVRLFAACRWELLRGRNVIGIIRGSTPDSNKGEAEAVVLAAPLDSLSEVPELSPGARDAGNCAALLQIAQHLSQSRQQERDVVVAFLDGQAQCHAGARAFYGALYRRVKQHDLADHSIDDRLRMSKEEKDHVRAILDVLMQPNIFSPDVMAMRKRGDAMRMLSSETRRLGNQVMQSLGPMRVEFAKLQSSANTPEAKRRLQELKPDGPALGLIDELEVEDLCWNTILRMINKDEEINDKKRYEAYAALLISDKNSQRQQLKRELFVARAACSAKLAIEQARANCKKRLDELDIASKEANQARALLEAVGRARDKIVLHISINLGDANPRWSFIHGDDSTPTLTFDAEGLYARIFKAIRQTHEVLRDQTPTFDVRPVSALYSSRMFAPGQFVDSSAAPRMFRMFNLSIMTVMDPFSRQGQPCDTLDALNAETMFIQTRGAAVLLRALLNHPGLSRDYPYGVAGSVVYDEARWSGVKSSGHVVKQSDVGDPMRAASVPGAVVAVVPNVTGAWEDCTVEKAPPGFNQSIRAMTQSNGIFEMAPVIAVWGQPQSKYFIATFGECGAGFQPANAMNQQPGKAAPHSRGIIENVTVENSLLIPGTLRNTARVHSRTVVGYGYDRWKVPTTVMRAISTAKFRADRHLLCESDNILTLYAPFDARAAKLFNPYGMALLNNTSTKELYQGQGVPVGEAFSHPVTFRETAKDLYTLNDYRLRLLRDNRIGQPSLEVLHGRAADIRADAESLEVKSADRYYGMLAASAAFSRRVYKPLVAVMNDLVKAVVLLLLLAIPFAYALERLLIGTPRIYRRIGWFTVFFLITFGVLYAVNPAFKLAAMPIIIFLAFAIILLSSLVMFIMFRKLRAEMKKMQGLGAAAHSADISRLSTMMAAVTMGISTMRRRPLRTLLSSITIVLLTFTILTFASFGSSWGNRKTYWGPMSDAPPRIIVRYPFWNPIHKGIVDTLRGFLTDRADVVPRYWLSPLPEDVNRTVLTGESLDMLLATTDIEHIVPVSAAIGFDARDISRQDRLRNCFAPNARLDLLETNGIFLAGVVSQALGLGEDSIGKTEILLAGRRLVYAGDIEDRVAVQNMLDGSSILPVDYAASAGGEAVEIAQPADLETMAETESAQFITYNVGGVVVIPGRVARSMGAKVRSVCIYPRRPGEVELIANDVAAVSALPTYFGTQGGVYRLYFATLVKASGLGDLLIPVALGGLIVFATMLGSITDRELEIYTFSSLGLAPVHIAGLSFAEASFYAIVGGMGGYLLGQAAVSILGLLSQYGHFSVPSMNFSSTNAIVTIFIVMSTVVLATIYPAVKASRSANPGIQRTWKIAEPKGDLHDLVFPFTVSEYDLTGVVSFLEEHFNNLRDASVGDFATEDCRVIRQAGNNMLGLQAHVALAPFDLGIEQDLSILSRPSDVEGIDEVRVVMRRTSGAYRDWRRANRVFINELRKQFLLWRALDPEVSDEYRERTLARLSELPIYEPEDPALDHRGGAATSN